MNARAGTTAPVADLPDYGAGAAERVGFREDSVVFPWLPAPEHGHQRCDHPASPWRFGPPMLLLHGNPQNHVAWHRVAARLAQRYHVILPDLRGYGDSSLPEAGPDNVNYSFRAMAQDVIEIMDELGHRTFYLAGVDRGGRVAHRLCLDHPDRVIKVCLMDVIPNYYVWTHPTKNWVIGTWHWAFMAQPEPFPERMISAVPTRSSS